MSDPVSVDAKALVDLHAQSLAAFGGAAGMRDGGLLESAMARARNLYAYGEADIATLAAACAYGIVRNHPFIDGNKRAALLAVGIFLDRNGFRLTAGELDVAARVLALADGALDEAGFAAWLRANIVAAGD